MGANVYKYLFCTCGYKKVDPSGKGRGDCKNCGLPMYLSENWYSRTCYKGRTTIKSHSPRKRDAEDYVSRHKIARADGTLVTMMEEQEKEKHREKDVSWADAVTNCKKWWADAVTRKEIKQSTADYYSFNMPALTAFFSGKTLLTIKKTDIIEYQTERSKLNKAPVTINHEVKALGRMYAMHLARTTAEESPRLSAKATDIGRVALLKNDRKKIRFLTLEEIKLLLDTATTPAVKMATLISLNTGLRRANVLGLTWSEVKLSKKTITLPGTVMKSGREHTVDIPAHLVPILKEWRDSHKLSKYLFPDLTGKAPMNNFRISWEKTIKACGPTFDDVTFHSLRHTFASQWLMNGGDITVLSKIMDHSSISITMDVYGHLSRDHKTKATAQFADVFLSQFG